MVEVWINMALALAQPAMQLSLNPGAYAGYVFGRSLAFWWAGGSGWGGAAEGGGKARRIGNMRTAGGGRGCPGLPP